MGVSLKKKFFFRETLFHSVTTQTQAVVTIYYHCMVLLLPSNADRVLTGILKTGFIESIPGKSWSQNGKIGVRPGKVLVFSFSRNMKSFIYGRNVFYPAKWQFQNPCED